MIKNFRCIIDWWDSLGTKPANPAAVWWILLSWFVLCAAVLYKCG